MQMFKLVFVLMLVLLHGSANAETVVEYGITGSYQNISKDSGKVTSPIAGSIDFVVDMDLGGGVLHTLMEGSNGSAGRAASVIAGANRDVGTATDGDGSARLQLSEFSYTMDFFAYDFAIGIQNLFAFVDANSSSNSETDQFMSSALVNNPTIAMPDYTMSAVFNYGYENRTNATFMVANAYGIADNASLGYKNTYTDLFDFTNAADGTKKGIFALAEVRMEDQDLWLTLGTWMNTREVDSLKGSYANLDYSVNEDVMWSVRYGWNDTKTDIDTFASFSTLFVSDEDTYGAAAAWANAVGADAPVLLETYYRWQLSDNLTLTPDVQFWWNANGLADTSGGTTGGKVIVYGLRLQYGDSVTY
ncbi:MAG: carbohydrate porin [Ghiorsea sp.]